MSDNSNTLFFYLLYNWIIFIMIFMIKQTFIKKLNEVGIKDVSEVGGKNASLGEMIKI